MNNVLISPAAQQELQRAIEAERMRAAEIPAARESDVSGQISMQDKLISDLIDYVQKLEGRLSPILRDVGPAPTEANKVNEHLVPLANKIRGNNEGIIMAVTRINSIIERIEL